MYISPPTSRDQRPRRTRRREQSEKTQINHRFTVSFQYIITIYIQEKVLETIVNKTHSIFKPNHRYSTRQTIVISDNHIISPTQPAIFKKTPSKLIKFLTLNRSNQTKKMASKHKGNPNRQSPRLTSEKDLAMEVDSQTDSQTDNESVMDTTLESEHCQTMDSSSYQEDESMYMSILDDSDNSHNSTILKEIINENPDKDKGKDKNETTAKTTETKPTSETPKPIKPPETTEPSKTTENAKTTEPEITSKPHKTTDPIKTLQKNSESEAKSKSDKEKDGKQNGKEKGITEKANVKQPATERQLRNRKEPMNYADVHNGKGSKDPKQNIKPKEKSKAKDGKEPDSKSKTVKEGKKPENTKEGDIVRKEVDTGNKNGNKEKKEPDNKQQESNKKEPEKQKPEEEIERLKQQLAIAEESRTRNIAEKIKAQQEKRSVEKEKARLDDILAVKVNINQDLHNQSVTKGRMLNEMKLELKNTKEKLEAKTKEVETSSNEADRRIAEIVEKYEKRINQIEENHEKEKQTIEREWNIKYDRLKKEGEENKKRLETVERLNKVLYQKIKAQKVDDASEGRQSEEPVSITRNLLVMDSNRKQVIEHLQTDDRVWEIEREIYTLRQLEEYVRRNKAELKMRDNVVIGVGLNDMRNRTGGIEAYERLKELSKELETRDNNVLILEVTPVRDAGKTMEIEVANACLRADKDIRTIQLPKEIEEMRIDELTKEDGYHITENVGRMIASAINKEIQGTDSAEETIEETTAPNEENQTPTDETIEGNNQTRPTDSVELEMQIPTRMGPHLVGKDGRNINRLEREYIVKVATKNSEGRTQTVKITGQRRNVEEARNAICTQIEEREEHDRTTRQYRENRICYYFQKGWCKNGEECDFIHPEVKEEQDRGRERQRSRRGSYYRSRSPRNGNDYRHRSRSRRGDWGDEPEWYEDTHNFNR